MSQITRPGPITWETIQELFQPKPLTREFEVVTENGVRMLRFKDCGLSFIIGRHDFTVRANKDANEFQVGISYVPLWKHAFRFVAKKLGRKETVIRYR